MTITSYIVQGMSIPPLEKAPEPVPAGTRCALTGEPIERGYLVWDIINNTVGEYLDLLGGQPTGWISEDTARAFKGSWNMGSWLIFEDGTGYHPLISREQAEAQERPCWSDLVREVWPAREGEGVLCILATDVKKRVWPKARLGFLGRSTPVMIHDPKLNLSSVLRINWTRMVEVLDMVEEIYALGFAKPNIRENLLRDLKRSSVAGYSKTIAWERELMGLRATPEFQMAYLIAQKGQPK